MACNTLEKRFCLILDFQCLHGHSIGIFTFKFLNAQWILSFVGKDVCYLSEYVKRKVCAVSIVNRNVL